MTDVADSVPTPQNPNTTDTVGEFMTVEAILGRENYENGLHYTSVQVRNRPGNIIQEPLDETVEEPQISARDKNKYYSERERLKTFVKWTDSYHASPQDLARNGFIHTGPRDQVMCVFCFGTKAGWKRGDNVRIGHVPSCQFVMGGFNGINKPILRERNSQHTSNDLLTLEPSVPAFVDEVTRLGTFQYWPSTNNQDPKALAAAGFFYKPQAGKPDRVKCFMCGKILYRWEPNDDPWREHARISRFCKFVQEVKGQKFVDECHAPKETLMSETPKSNGNVPPQNPVSPSDSQLSEDDPLKHTAVQAILQSYRTDYSEEQVVNAFKKLSLDKGGDNVKASDLLEELMDGEE